MIRTALALGLSFGLLSLSSQALAQDAWENLTYEKLDEVASAALDKAQELSLKNNREYCGYIAFDGGERLRFTNPLKGDVESCQPPEVPGDWELIASYHTHGALDPNDPEVTFELPSSDDLRGDMEEGVDGYLATPGGRFWFIDTIDEVVTQIGGVGYFAKDRNFTQDKECGPHDTHTFDEIFIMEEDGMGPCEL